MGRIGIFLAYGKYVGTYILAVLDTKLKFYVKLCYMGGGVALSIDITLRIINKSQCMIVMPNSLRISYKIIWRSLHGLRTATIFYRYSQKQIVPQRLNCSKR